MIPFASLRLKTNNQIAQAFPVGQLAKQHTHQLIPTGKMLNLIVAIEFFDTLNKIVDWQEFCDLRKDIFSGIHTRICQKPFKSFEP